MKSILLFVSVILLPVYVFSQEADSSRQSEYDYLDLRGKIVDTREKAAYIRVYVGFDSISGLYEVRDYAVSGGALVSARSFSDGNYTSPEGPAVWFAANQKHLKRGQYSKGKPSGQWVEFYPNGQKKKLYTYLEPEPGKDRDAYTINGSWDSTGQAEVTDGNGMFTERDDSTGAVTGKGMIKSGLRNGLWQFFLKDGQKSYEEFNYQLRITNYE